MGSSQRLSYLCLLGLLILACISALPALAATSTPQSVLTSTKNIIVWQRFGPWLMITEDQIDGRVCYFYDPVVRSKMNVKKPLKGSWMPLGSAIKWLMYVDNYQGLDRLMAHDVDWHYYYIAWNSAQNQVGCGMIDTKCIYGQYRASQIGDYFPVDLYAFNVETGACDPFCISDSNKSQFAHDGNLIVYRSYSGPRTARITGHYFSGGDEFTIAQRDGIDPAVDGSLVAWAEVSGDGYDIVAKNLETGEIRTVAHTTANQPCPEVGQGSVFWRDSRNYAKTGIDIYGYDWLTGQEYIVTNATGDQQKLRASGNFVTWVTGPINYQTLWLAKIIAPVKITDLHATLVNDNSVQLAWTSQGSSDNPATSYELRMRQETAITDSNWYSSNMITELPTPETPGQLEKFTVQGLTTGHYYFAIKAKLKDGQYSLLSNCISAYISDSKSALAADAGSYIGISGTIAGVGADSSIYAQITDSMHAVKIVPLSGQGSVSAGQQITATGKLSQSNDYFGAVIDEATITALPGGISIRCIGMSNKALGGYDPVFGGTPDHGASNLWMRVKSWGRVSELATDNGCSFYINDGSMPKDNGGKGVLIISPYAPPSGLANGVYVSVEGISKVSRASGREIEVVDQNGITVVSNY